MRFSSVQKPALPQNMGPLELLVSCRGRYCDAEILPALYHRPRFHHPIRNVQGLPTSLSKLHGLPTSLSKLPALPKDAEVR